MRSLAFVAAVPLIATAALAQTPTPDTPSGQEAQSNQQGQADQEAVQQQVQQNLQQEGFTDIRVVPRSFLVSAKDKQGNQVMMFITPNSVTAIKRLPGNNTTTGQGGSPSQNGQSGSTGQGEEGSPQASPNGK